MSHHMIGVLWQPRDTGLQSISSCLVTLFTILSFMWAICELSAFSQIVLLTFLALLKKAVFQETFKTALALKCVMQHCTGHVFLAAAI